MKPTTSDTIEYVTTDAWQHRHATRLVIVAAPVGRATSSLSSGLHSRPNNF
jgi:hypothetical protein